MGLKKMEKIFFIYSNILPSLLLERSILYQIGLNALSSADHKVLLTKSLETY